MLCNIISYKAILIRDKGHLLCLAYLVLLISLTKFRSTQSTVAVVLEGLTLFWRISLPMCISMFSPIWFQEKQESSLLWIAPVLSLLFLHFFSALECLFPEFYFLKYWNQILPTACLNLLSILFDISTEGTELLDWTVTVFMFSCRLSSTTQYTRRQCDRHFNTDYLGPCRRRFSAVWSHMYKLCKCFQGMLFEKTVQSMQLIL